MKTYIYADTETIPDESRQHLFEVDRPEKLPPRKDCPLLVTDAANLTVSGIESLLARECPSVEFCDALLSQEHLRKGGPREGVIKALEKFSIRESDNAAAWEAYHKTLSITPEYNRVIALGVLGGGLPITVTECLERTILEVFWEAVRPDHRNEAPCVVGYNIAFDIRTICVRSRLLGVKPSRVFDLTPWKGDLIDLAYARFGGIPPKGMNLAYVCKLMGYQDNHNDIDGSGILAAYKAGKWGEIANHVSSDVKRAEFLHQQYAGLFCPAI